MTVGGSQQQQQNRCTYQQEAKADKQHLCFLLPLYIWSDTQRCHQLEDRVAFKPENLGLIPKTQTVKREKRLLQLFFDLKMHDVAQTSAYTSTQAHIDLGKHIANVILKLEMKM